MGAGRDQINRNIKLTQVELMEVCCISVNMTYNHIWQVVLKLRFLELWKYPASDTM